MSEAPEIRSKLINLVWKTISECIFTDTIKPPLTFEEVQIIQNRLNEWVEATKFEFKMQLMYGTKEKPINDSSYVK